MPELLERTVELLRKYPEIAVFLTLGLGYLLGQIKVKKFGLGAVVGTLVVGMLIGQAKVEVPTFARTVFFLLFMFGTGYHVGPQFFVSLRRGGVKLVVLSLIFAFVALGMTILTAWYLRLDAGLTGGLLSGSLTQSSAIGTSSEAIARLELPQQEKEKLIGHVPVADAVTYLYGTIGVTLLLTKAFPAIMRKNLEQECAAFEKELGGSLEHGPSTAFEAPVRVDVQAYRLSEPSFVGKTVGELQRAAGERPFIARVRRDHVDCKPDSSYVLRAGDVVVISGPRADLLKIGPSLGEQVVDPGAMALPFEKRRIIITAKQTVGLTMGEVRSRDELKGQGVHMLHFTRGGEPLPVLPRTVIERGDVVDLVGAPEDLDRVTPLLGVADLPTDRTNFVILGITIALGALVGIVSIRLGNVPLGMGTGGGVLVAGLLLGWLQTVAPRLGRIPSPAIWLMENLGLLGFIAMVGLAAGPHAVEAMQTAGVQLLLGSIVVATVPHALTFAVGHFMMRLNAGQLMGALAGAGTITAGLQALVEESRSSVPVLGYTVPYAINNILLTAWGPVVVAASQLWA